MPQPSDRRPPNLSPRCVYATVEAVVAAATMQATSHTNHYHSVVVAPPSLHHMLSAIMPRLVTYCWPSFGEYPPGCHYFQDTLSIDLIYMIWYTQGFCKGIPILSSMRCHWSITPSFPHFILWDIVSHDEKLFDSNPERGLCGGSVDCSPAKKKIEDKETREEEIIFRTNPALPLLLIFSGAYRYERFVIMARIMNLVQMYYSRIF